MKDGLFQIKSDRIKFVSAISITLIIIVGGVFTGIFLIPMFEEVEGENKQVTIGEPNPKELTFEEGIAMGLNQNDEILLKMDKIIEEQKYQRQLLEEIYDLES